MSDSLPLALAGFAAAAAVIALGGTWLSALADRLADRTGLGEALVGMLLLGGATSLPDFGATLSAALAGRPELAMSNAMGSMAAVLAFLAVADIVYRKANLEHAAASEPNLMQAALFIALLAIALLAGATPRIEVWGVHPATPLLVLGYVFGIHLVRRSHAAPMWRPKHTAETVEDRPDQRPARRSLALLWLQFGALAGLTAAAGWWLMQAAAAIVDQTGLAEGVAGGVMTAVSTSLPELVTTIAAVRRGALTLAMGNIVGTNCFNVMVIAAADIAYRRGSIYHDLSPAELAWGLMAILMTAVLLLGMVRRETHGIGNIGFESFLILLLYGAAVLLALA